MWLGCHIACQRIKAALLAALLSLPLWVAGQARGGIIYVDDDAPANGDGLSWDSAFANLQLALDVASDPKSSVSEIRVGQGSYKSTELVDSTDPRSATFEMINGVVIAGGFAGIGTKDPDQRDVVRFQTVLSGDLLGNDGPPGSFANYEDNAYHVLTASGTDTSAALDGVTVQAGNAICPCSERDTRRWGGGLRAANASPTLVDCTFRFNRALRGGGVHINDGSPTFYGCTFLQNWAVTDPNNGAGEGGGVYLSACIKASFSHCIWTQNKATYMGGGLSERNSATSFIECTFQGNVAEEHVGGGMIGIGGSRSLAQCIFSKNAARSAGGMKLSGIEAIIKQCTFLDNEAENGHGGAVLGPFNELVVRECQFIGNLTLNGWAGDLGVYEMESGGMIDLCIFEDNLAGGNGGALAIAGGSPAVARCRFTDNHCGILGVGGAVYLCGSSSLLDRCVFDFNSAPQGGALATCEFGGAPVIANCLFTNNSTYFIGNGGAILNLAEHCTVANSTFYGNSTDSLSLGGAIFSENNGSTNIVNCVLRNNSPDSVFDHPFIDLNVNYCNIEGGWAGDGTGNIDRDPLFANAAESNFNLLPGSPCIDAADNRSVPAGLDGDLNDAPRFQDDADTPDTGNGLAPLVDMGCYELQPLASPCPADCAEPHDGFVGILDLNFVISSWGVATGPSDITGNGVVDVDDLLAVINHWGTCP